MKKITILMAVFLAAAIGAFADDENRQCTAPMEDCSEKLRQVMQGRKFLGLIFYDSETGIYVKSVVEGGPADKAGIRGGDYIVRIEGKDVSDGNVKAFKKLFGKAEKKGRVALSLRRGEEIIETEALLTEITEAQIRTIVAAHIEAAHQDTKVSTIDP
jgi:C-terminal processing protease CtpA/Prc